MGRQPKQLILYKGQTLIRRMTETALALQRGPVVVVLGAHREQVAPELAGLPITLVDNPAWETGQASSLKTGLAALYIMQKDIDAVFILHVDQPLVSIGLLQHLLAVRTETGKGIVACRYDTQLSVPALFSRDYIPDLLAMTGDRSVKWLIAQHRANCAPVPFEAGAIDLDSKRDVELFEEVS